MSNPRVALLFKELPTNYPHCLERDHAHILNRLMELWGTAELGPFIHDLLIDTRGGRHGFTLEVIAELMFFSELHNRFKREGLHLAEVVDSLPKVANGNPPTV